MTRANGTHPEDYWFNIGEFPMPGPQGEEGPAGETGPQGPTGNDGTNGLDAGFGSITASAVILSAAESIYASVTETGPNTAKNLAFEFGIPVATDWGSISGNISAQADLMSKFDEYATVSALSSAVSDITSLSSDLATLSSNMSLYATVDSLSSYATQSWVTSQGYLSEVPSEYATEAWVSANFLSADTPIGGAATWGSISGTLSDQTDLMSKFSEYATLSDISGLASEGYVDSSISALSSIYAPIGSYASQADIEALSSVYQPIGSYLSADDLSSAISGLSSVYASIDALSSYALSSSLSLYALSSVVDGLDYLSVGALSSGTTIPTIPSARSGITLAGGYYGLSTIIPLSLSFASTTSTSFYGHVRFKSNATFEQSVCFGGSAIYNGSNITYGAKLDLPSQSGSLALITDIPSVSGYAQLSGMNFFTSYNQFQDNIDVYSAITFHSDIMDSLWFGGAIKADMEELHIRGSAGLSLTTENGDIFLSDSQSSFTLQEIALKSEIPSLYGYATESFVTSSISALSSIYQPIGSYVSSADLSGYAELSGINTFTSINTFSSAVKFLTSTYAKGAICFGTSVQGDGAAPKIYASDYHNLVINATGHSEATILFNDHFSSFMLSEIALKSEIPSVSEYATISAVSSAISDLSSVYASISYVDALSSVYAPLSYVSGANDGTNWTSLTIGSETYGFAGGGGGGGIPSGYASEVWTFTLSGGSTVSKTMLVGE